MADPLSWSRARAVAADGALPGGAGALPLSCVPCCELHPMAGRGVSARPVAASRLTPRMVRKAWQHTTHWYLECQHTTFLNVRSAVGRGVQACILEPTLFTIKRCGV